MTITIIWSNKKKGIKSHTHEGRLRGWGDINLSRADLKINTRETFQVLFQKSLRIILSYLLSSHFNNSNQRWSTKQWNSVQFATMLLQPLPLYYQRNRILKKIMKWMVLFCLKEKIRTDQTTATQQGCVL
jgi:hypothetical protein